MVQRGNPHCAPPQLKEPSYGFPRRERERHGGRDEEEGGGAYCSSVSTILARRGLAVLARRGLAVLACVIGTQTS